MSPELSPELRVCPRNCVPGIAELVVHATRSSCISRSYFSNAIYADWWETCDEMDETHKGDTILIKET